jgi:hypothetical protein
VPTVADPLSKVAQTQKSCLLPVYSKPGLYYEVRRRLEALPGVPQEARFLALSDGMVTGIA